MLSSSQRLVVLVSLGACVAGAQSFEVPLSSPPIVSMQRGYFHGTMVRWEGTPALGELIARNVAGELFGCGYDAKTYLEMQNVKITVAKLAPGDPLEILADRKPGSRTCYMRIVQVVAPSAKRPGTVKPPPLARAKDPLPRGDRTLAGTVAKIDGNLMTLRTRDGLVEVDLRRDTRYFSDGLETDLAALSINQRISVKAGPTLEGTLQAYQINWGGIVNVR